MKKMAVKVHVYFIIILHEVHITYSKIDLTFTCTQQIAIFTDYRQDESYTPNKIAIRAGSHFHDLQVISAMHPALYPRLATILCTVSKKLKS